MALVVVWLRLALRRRWRSLAVLTLLVALTAGVVLTAVAGARRGGSALDRLLERTQPATLAVLPTSPGFDWDAVRALPGVAGLSEFGSVPAEIDGAEADLSFDLGSDTVERPVVLAGRLPDPAGPDEAAITPAYTQMYGLGVGDTVTVRLPDPAAFAARESFAAGMPPPTGPVVAVRIVAVVRSFVLTDRLTEVPSLYPSAAFVARYRDNLLGPDPRRAILQALVRLDGGTEAVPAFQAALVGLTGRTDISYFDLAAQQVKIGRTLRFEAAALLAFGLAALAAATVLVGQAVARYTASEVAELQVLRSLGMPVRHALLAAVGGPAAAGLVGTAAGVTGAVAASGLFPIGTAAGFEPDPGPDVDALVLGGGGVLLVVLVVGGAAAAARLALARRDPGTSRRAAVAATAARLGLPVPVLVGIRFALEPGRGHTALPVRPALVGAVTGVLGVLAAFTFSAGVTEAAENPARFGQTHQFAAYLGFFGEDLGVPAGPLLAAIGTDPDVAGTLEVRDGVIDVRGATGAARPVTVFTGPAPGARPYPTVLSAGRMPERADEIVLAPGTAQLLGAAPGDTVAATGTRGGGALTVSGIGFVPVGPHNFYDDGAWLTPAGYDGLTDTFRFHTGLVALRPGVDPGAVADRLVALAATAGGDGVALEPVAPLYEATLLRNVEVLPVVLGGFLALLAVGAVGHALATAVRRRRHDLAVLRALGMTRGQTRAVVVTQATILAGVGLLVGVPVGIALGRTLWRVVADITPLQYAPPAALVALALVGPLALIITNALAAWPARQAARLRVAGVLRAE